MTRTIEDEISRILPMFGYKLETMPGISTVTAAALIAEIGDINCFASVRGKMILQSHGKENFLCTVSSFFLPW